MSMDAHIAVEYVENYAGSDKTRFHFSFRYLLKLLMLIGPAYESTPIVHNASSFLTWLRFHFNKYNMRNKNYTDICQFSLIVSEEIKLQIICSAHDCDHSFSISNLWAKLTASAYKNWNSSSTFLCASLYIWIIFSIFLNPKFAHRHVTQSHIGPNGCFA